MSNDLAQSINKSIIDVIMNSPLNIAFIPDDIEREMYEKILETIEMEIENNKPAIEKSMSSCFEKIFCCCRKDVVPRNSKQD